MTDVYYQLSDGTNTLTFVMTSISDSETRDIWDMKFPYVQHPFLTDQIATTREIAINATIKPGTSKPYATVKAALTAIANLTPSTYNTGWTLKGGNWNGSSWTYNSDYPWEISGTEKLMISMGRKTQKAGENYLTGQLELVINVKFGTVY